MKKPTIIAAGAAALLGIAIPVHANHTASHCASYGEFAKIRAGMTKAQVADVIGYRGKLVSSYSGEYVNSEDRKYKVCDGSADQEFSEVFVGFSSDNGGKVRVDVKNMNIFFK